MLYCRCFNYSNDNNYKILSKMLNLKFFYFYKNLYLLRLLFFAIKMALKIKIVFLNTNKHIKLLNYPALLSSCLIFVFSHNQFVVLQLNLLIFRDS